MQVGLLALCSRDAILYSYFLDVSFEHQYSYPGTGLCLEILGLSSVLFVAT